MCFMACVYLGLHTYEPVLVSTVQRFDLYNVPRNKFMEIKGR